MATRTPARPKTSAPSAIDTIRSAEAKAGLAHRPDLSIRERAARVEHAAGEALAAARARSERCAEMDRVMGLAPMQLGAKLVGVRLYLGPVVAGPSSTPSPRAPAPPSSTPRASSGGDHQSPEAVAAMDRAMGLAPPLAAKRVGNRLFLGA